MTGSGSKIGIKKWLARKIASAAFQSVESLPIAALKYVPYKRRERSYWLPKVAVAANDRAGDGLAVPPANLRPGYSTAEEHLALGRQDVDSMLYVLLQSGFEFADGQRILDFGCGSGRMIRYLNDLSGRCEVWGTDINAEQIVWCQQNLSPPFKFATTTTVPHLPFEDRHFDLIYAGSVFTHIEDLTEAWLLELKRILKADGRLYLTIHDEHTVELLETEYKELPLAEKLRYHLSAAQDTRDHGMLVLGREMRSQVFYNSYFFRKKLETMYEVLSVTPEAYGYQTGFVAKRRSCGD